MASRLKYWQDTMVRVRYGPGNLLSDWIPAQALEGLAVHPVMYFDSQGQISGRENLWRITHIGTGLGVGPHYPRERDARLFTERLVTAFPELWRRGEDIYMDPRLHAAGRLVREEMGEEKERQAYVDIWP